MERPQSGDDDIAAGSADAAGKLDGAFVRLGAGVREEDLTPCCRAVAHEAVQIAGQAAR